MLVLALSLTAFHVKSKTRSSSSPPLSLFVKIRFLFLTLLLSGFKEKLLYLKRRTKKTRGHMIQKDKKISRDFMCSILDALLVYIHTMINEKTYGTFSLRPIYHCKSPSFSIAVSSLESTPESLGKATRPLLATSRMPYGSNKR